MRYFLPTFLLLFMTGTGTAWCVETTPDEVIVIPVNVKDQALEKTLEYGQELCLRQDFDQATKLFKHVLTLDPCNTEARETLATIAKKGPATKGINDFLNGLKCVMPAIPAPVREDQKVPTFEQRATPAVSGTGFHPTAPGTTTVALPAPATPAVPQLTPLQGATLQEKMADLQKKVQRIENAAQAQNTRLDKLNNVQPVTKN
jgi:hypothetical protein